MQNNTRGLTLIELIIVVTILGILLLASIAYFRGQILKGNDAKRKADIHKIQVAVEEYEKDHDCYPPPDVVDCDPGDGLKPYLNKIACDPASGASYHYDHEDASCPRWYILYAALDNDSDVDYQAGIGPNGAFSYYAASPNAPTPTVSESGSGPGSGSGSGSGGASSDFYGCKSGSCVPLSSQTECSPNYTTASCGNGCASSPECEPL